MRKRLRNDGCLFWRDNNYMKLILDYTISETDIVNMADMDLSDLFLYTDRDKSELDVYQKITG